MALTFDDRPRTKRMREKQIPKTLVLAALSVVAASAQTAKETPAQFRERTQWWREAKFGMFIHWGIYSVPADSLDLKGKKGIAEWYFSNKQMQVKDYEKFAAQFNPTKFDARTWVKTAKDAGMKYIVITSKHHDGFDMFDTKLSNYCITKATPFKRDPMKELAAECKKQGVRLCFYHSIMDWHHPEYVPRRPWLGQDDVLADAGPVMALIERTGAAAHLVGHSYGGVIALAIG